jgi:hypothetical protein
VENLAEFKPFSTVSQDTCHLCISLPPQNFSKTTFSMELVLSFQPQGKLDNKKVYTREEVFPKPLLTMVAKDAA